MNVYFMVFGSSIVRWRFVRSTGKALAEGWSEPFLQKAGLFGPRTAAANHTRPLRSNMPLWLFALLVQTCSLPQYGDGCIGPSSIDVGVSASRTGVLKSVTLFVFGSRIGMTSTLSSVEP